MTIEQLQNLKRQITQVDHKLEEIKNLNAEFSKVQSHFSLESDSEKNTS